MPLGPIRTSQQIDADRVLGRSEVTSTRHQRGWNVKTLTFANILFFGCHLLRPWQASNAFDVSYHTVTRCVAVVASILVTLQRICVSRALRGICPGPPSPAEVRAVAAGQDVHATVPAASTTVPGWCILQRFFDEAAMQVFIPKDFIIRVRGADLKTRGTHCVPCMVTMDALSTSDDVNDTYWSEPKIMEDGTGACIWAVFQTEALRWILDLIKTLNYAFVLLSLVADAASPNKCVVRIYGGTSVPHPTMVHYQRCDGHQLHIVMMHAMHIVSCIGRLYAICKLINFMTYRTSLLTQLRSFVCYELVYTRGEAIDAEADAYANWVMYGVLLHGEHDSDQHKLLEAASLIIMCSHYGNYLLSNYYLTPC
jgi:hypothetical protein